MGQMINRMTGYMNDTNTGTAVKDAAITGVAVGVASAGLHFANRIGQNGGFAGFVGRQAQNAAGKAETVTEIAKGFKGYAQQAYKYSFKALNSVLDFGAKQLASLTTDAGKLNWKSLGSKSGILAAAAAGLYLLGVGVNLFERKGND